MRGPGIVTLALALACSVISVAAQQPDVRLAQSTVETQKVTGTVKTTTDNGTWSLAATLGTRTENGHLSSIPARVSRRAVKPAPRVIYGRVIPSR